MSPYKISDLVSIKDSIDENSNPLQDIVNTIVSKHCSALDEYMKIVDEALCEDKDIPTSELESMLMNINSILYWTGNGLEEAIIKESMAKMVQAEQFNTEYSKAEGTIGDKKAAAQLNSQKEELVKLCYSNAVKLYQHKIDRAAEMSSVMKKILSHRIQEYQTSRMEIR